MKTTITILRAPTLRLPRVITTALSSLAARDVGERNVVYVVFGIKIVLVFKLIVW